MLALVCSACVSRSDDGAARSSPRGKYGSALADEATPGVGGGAPGTGAPSGLKPDPDRPGGAAAAPRAPSGQARIDDNARLGVNARAYLSAQIPRLVVEIDAVTGHEPSAQALDLLRDRLVDVSDKPRGVEFLPVETFTEDRAPWTEADLLTAERRHRDRHSTPQEMVLYVLYVDGAFAEESDALGVAFKASTFAVFAERIDDAATPLVSAASIERSVLVHELGHVLALVNIGYTSPRPREDPDHDAHSSNPDSVMYWAVDNVGVAGLLGGRSEPPTDFDADDRADLEDIKNGRIRIG